MADLEREQLVEFAVAGEQADFLVGIGISQRQSGHDLNAHDRGPVGEQPDPRSELPVPGARLGFGPGPVFADALVEGYIADQRKTFEQTELPVQAGRIAALVRYVDLPARRPEIRTAFDHLLVQLEITLPPGMGPSAREGRARLKQEPREQGACKDESGHVLSPRRIWKCHIVARIRDSFERWTSLLQPPKVSETPRIPR